MTREELEKKYVDLAYAHITSDVSAMTEFVWDTLNDSVEDMDEDTLHHLITLYSDEEEEE